MATSASPRASVGLEYESSLASETSNGGDSDSISLGLTMSPDESPASSALSSPAARRAATHFSLVDNHRAARSLSQSSSDSSTATAFVNGALATTTTTGLLKTDSQSFAAVRLSSPPPPRALSPLAYFDSVPSLPDYSSMIDSMIECTISSPATTILQSAPVDFLKENPDEDDGDDDLDDDPFFDRLREADEQAEELACRSPAQANKDLPLGEPCAPLPEHPHSVAVPMLNGSCHSSDGRTTTDSGVDDPSEHDLSQRTGTLLDDLDMTPSLVDSSLVAEESTAEVTDQEEDEQMTVKEQADTTADDDMSEYDEEATWEMEEEKKEEEEEGEEKEDEGHTIEDSVVIDSEELHPTSAIASKGLLTDDDEDPLLVAKDLDRTITDINISPGPTANASPAVTPYASPIASHRRRLDSNDQDEALDDSRDYVDPLAFSPPLQTSTPPPTRSQSHPNLSESPTASEFSASGHFRGRRRSNFHRTVSGDEAAMLAARLVDQSREANLGESIVGYAFGTSLGSITRRKPVAFAVQSLTLDGAKKTTGGDRVVVQLTTIEENLPASPTAVPRQPLVIDNRDGTYDAVYRVDEAGSFHLNISVNGVPVLDSPFLVEVAEEAAAPQCRVEGDGLHDAFVDEPAHFRVLAYFADGTPKTTGGDRVEVDFEREFDGALVPCVATINDNRDGSYDVHYTMDRPGHYVIVTLLNGSHVGGDLAGSALHVRSLQAMGVVNEEVDPSKCYASGEGLDVVLVRQTAHFHVHTMTHEGRAKASGGDRVTVQIESLADGRDESHTVVVTDFSNGLFLVEYQLNTAETYLARIQVNGQAIAGCPYTILVVTELGALQDVRPSPSLSHVCPPHLAGSASIASLSDGSAQNHAPKQPPVVVRRSSSSNLELMPIPSEPESIEELDEVDANRCYLDGLAMSYGALGTTSFITLYLMLTSGEPKTSGDDDVRVTLADPSGSTNAVGLSAITDRHDGSYQIAYRVTRVGIYHMKILVNGLPIPDSPLSIRVGLGACPALSYIIGDSLPGTPDDPVPAGERSRCKLQSVGYAGEQVRVGGRTMLATVSDSTVLAAPLFEDCRDGTYALVYDALAPGTCNVHILMDGQAIRGSPFNVTVSASAIEARGAETFVRLHNDTILGCVDASAWPSTLQAIADATETHGRFLVGPVTFEVQSNRKRGGDMVRVAVEGPSHSRVDIVDCGTGLYRVTLVVQYEGHYRLAVTINDESVVGSPVCLAAIAQAEPSKCRIETESLASVEVGVPAIFTMQARDVRGHPVLHGGDVVEVFAELEQAHSDSSVNDGAMAKTMDTVRGIVRDSRKGSYSCAFVLPKPGLYAVSVRLGDRHIAGSPFLSTASCSKFDERLRVRAYGDGLRSARVGMPSSFIVNSGSLKPLAPVQAGLTPPPIVTVTITGPRDVIPNIVDQGSGSHFVTWEPTCSGKYLISIRANQKRLVGSPFPVFVKVDPRKVVTRVTRLTKEALCRDSAGTESAATSLMTPATTSTLSVSSSEPYCHDPLVPAVDTSQHRSRTAANLTQTAVNRRKMEEEMMLRHKLLKFKATTTSVVPASPEPEASPKRQAAVKVKSMDGHDFVRDRVVVDMVPVVAHQVMLVHSPVKGKQKATRRSSSLDSMSKRPTTSVTSEGLAETAATHIRYAKAMKSTSASSDDSIQRATIQCVSGTGGRLAPTQRTASMPGGRYAEADPTSSHDRAKRSRSLPYDEQPESNKNLEVEEHVDTHEEDDDKAPRKSKKLFPRTLFAKQPGESLKETELVHVPTPKGKAGMPLKTPPRKKTRAQLIQERHAAKAETVRNFEEEQERLRIEAEAIGTPTTGVMHVLSEVDDDMHLHANLEMSTPHEERDGRQRAPLLLPPESVALLNTMGEAGAGIGGQTDAVHVIRLENSRDNLRITVTVVGDRSKPAMLTFHDIGLNHETCFGEFSRHRQLAQLLATYCVYHIDAPGHEKGAQVIASGAAYPSLHELSSAIDQVYDEFSLSKAVLFGSGAGANVLTLFALANPRRVCALIVSGLVACKPGLWEHSHVATSTWRLRHWGVSVQTENHLLRRYFGPRALSMGRPVTQMVRASLASSIPSRNIAHFWHTYLKRGDLDARLCAIQCPVLVLVGLASATVKEQLMAMKRLPRNRSTYIQVDYCGSLVQEERPAAVLEPLCRLLTSLSDEASKKQSVEENVTLSAAALAAATTSTTAVDESLEGRSMLSPTRVLDDDESDIVDIR